MAAQLRRIPLSGLTFLPSRAPVEPFRWRAGPGRLRARESPAGGRRRRLGYVHGWSCVADPSDEERARAVGTLHEAADGPSSAELLVDLEADSRGEIRAMTVGSLRRDLRLDVREIQFL